MYTYLIPDHPSCHIRFLVDLLSLKLGPLLPRTDIISITLAPTYPFCLYHSIKYRFTWSQPYFSHLRDQMILDLFLAHEILLIPSHQSFFNFLTPTNRPILSHTITLIDFSGYQEVGRRILCVTTTTISFLCFSPPISSFFSSCFSLLLPDYCLAKPILTTEKYLLPTPNTGRKIIANEK